MDVNAEIYVEICGHVQASPIARQLSAAKRNARKPIGPIGIGVAPIDIILTTVEGRVSIMGTGVRTAIPPESILGNAPDIMDRSGVAGPSSLGGLPKFGFPSLASPVLPFNPLAN